MRVVRAAAVPISPVLYSREATVEKVVWKIHELLSLLIDRTPTAHVHERAGHPKSAEQDSKEFHTTVA